MASIQTYRGSGSHRIATAASLAALASVISLVGLTFPFPLLPFLQFDPAEIPDMISFYLLGPTGGLSVTLVHWIILDFHGSFDPVIGPTMKFMAVFATMAGVYLGTFVAKSRFGRNHIFISVLGSGTALRFLLMLFPTFLLYYFISPNLYLTFAEKSLSAIGISVSGTLAAAVVVTLFTGIFNIFHAIFTISISWGVYKVARRMGVLARGIDWLGERLGQHSN
jgi:riboflavin transporter FmnP